MIIHLRKLHTILQYLDGPLVSECQSRFRELIYLLHLANSYMKGIIYDVFKSSYLVIIFIATFSPVFLFVALLTVAKLPL